MSLVNIYAVTDCNERQTEKRHECTNGKVKRLELWWQVYVTSLPVRDVRSFRPLNFVEQVYVFLQPTHATLHFCRSVTFKTLLVCIMQCSCELHSMWFCTGYLFARIVWQFAVELSVSLTPRDIGHQTDLCTHGFNVKFRNSCLPFFYIKGRAD